MAVTAGKAIGLPAAATPAVRLSELGLAFGAVRMVWQLRSRVHPGECEIAHVGSKSSVVQIRTDPCRVCELTDKGEVVITTRGIVDGRPAVDRDIERGRIQDIVSIHL